MQTVKRKLNEVKRKQSRSKAKRRTPCPVIKRREFDASEDEIELRDDAAIGRALRGSLAALVVLAAVGGAVAYWLSRPKPAPPVRESTLATVKIRDLPTVQMPAMPFTDITKEAGIAFVHNNGATGDKLLPETMGGGSRVLRFRQRRRSRLAIRQLQRLAMGRAERTNQDLRLVPKRRRQVRRCDGRLGT